MLLWNHTILCDISINYCIVNCYQDFTTLYNTSHIKILYSEYYCDITPSSVISLWITVSASQPHCIMGFGANGRLLWEGEAAGAMNEVMKKEAIKLLIS